MKCLRKEELEAAERVEYFIENKRTFFYLDLRSRGPWIPSLHKFILVSLFVCYHCSLATQI
jgi:hypothetical protein